MLRTKVKKNIIYIKKVYLNSESYVLIIRKSLLVSNICQANLYHLDDYYDKQDDNFGSRSAVINGNENATNNTGSNKNTKD